MHNYRDGGETATVNLTHSVDRIEVMVDAAVLVGRADKDLHFSSLELGTTPRVADVLIQANAAQGETRSHGFFFKADADRNGGVLGLPIRKQGEGYEHLIHGSAEVLFVDVNNNFRTIGALSASPEEPAADSCEVSCVDWYGNARPIFYKGRVFALLGYELVEGHRYGELDRVDMSSVLR